MRVFFEADNTLNIAAEDCVESMALKYWLKEFAAHGVKMLAVDTEVPLQLGYDAEHEDNPKPR